MQLYSYHGLMLSEYLNLEITVPYISLFFSCSHYAKSIFVRFEVDVTGGATPNAEEGLQPGHLTLTDNMKTLNS